MGMIRGRKPAGGGVHNPPSRGAVYDQRTYGSVGAGAGNRPGYPSAMLTRRARSAGGHSIGGGVSLVVSSAGVTRRG